MKRPFILLCAAILAACSAGSAFADHGVMGSTQRDAWINASLTRLAASGYLPAPKTPFDQQTNLEAAEDVARASERLLAQANTAPELPMLVDPSAPAAAPAVGAAEPQTVAPVAAVAPAATPTAAPPADMKLLVEEFRKELTALGVDMDKLSRRLKERRGIFSKLSKEQEKSLNKTGTDVGVYSRGYVYGHRTVGSGSDAYDSTIFTSMRFKSVPVPKLLFETDLRLWATTGWYYVDPAKEIDVRTITLSSTNKAGLFQVGDFFDHLTPLTLWNSSEVHELVEPRVMEWRRVDREEPLLMDKGDDWRLRGLRFANDGVALPIPKLSPLLAWKFMGGPVKLSTTKDYANYWSAGQVSLDFFDHKLDLAADGLRMWDDSASSHFNYLTDFPSTWGQLYQVGGLNPRLNWEVVPDVKIKADWDGATCKYNDDIFDNARYYQDWASILKGGVETHGVEFTGKAFNVGPNYYNPGSQTLRYTPGVAAGLTVPEGYVSSAPNYRDTIGFEGYRDRFLFTDVGRPTFAPYDRLEEAILPYGDATPNRKGFTAGLEAKWLKKGWLHPQAWYTTAKEIEPNWVRDSTGQYTTAGQVVAVDSITLHAPVCRDFTGIDAAVQMDLAVALGLKSTLGLGGEFKKQTSDLGYAKMDSRTIVGTLDLPPSVVCLPVLIATAFNSKVYENFNRWFKGLDFNVAVRQIKGSGREYGLDGTTLAEYAFQPVNTDLGKYSLMSYDLTRTELMMGVRYQISKTLNVRADWLQRTEKIDETNATTRDQEWRMMYEASF